MKKFNVCFVLADLETSAGIERQLTANAPTELEAAKEIFGCAYLFAPDRFFRIKYVEEVKP